MKQLDQYDVVSISGGAAQDGSPALAGIGASVDSLPTPICPVAELA